MYKPKKQSGDYFLYPASGFKYFSEVKIFKAKYLQLRLIKENDKRIGNSKEERFPALDNVFQSAHLSFDS